MNAIGKTNQFNWPEVAKDFLSQYIRKNIDKIAVEFNIQNRSLTPEVSTIYIEKIGLEIFEWEICDVCGKPSVMSQQDGYDNPEKFYCRKHMPKLELRSN